MLTFKEYNERKNKAINREEGTSSLLKIYMNDTPGQKKEVKSKSKNKTL